MAQLEKRISLYGLTMIAAGSCIGSGIFRAPSETARYLPYDSLLLLAWIIGGLITISGALSISELGGMYPRSGGVYVFLKEAYHEAFAFLYGWISLTVIVTGSLAALSLVFSSYVGSLIDLSDNQKLMLSLSVIITLSALNVLGVNIGNLLASIITSTKLLGIGVVIFIGFIFGTEHLDIRFHISDFHNNMPQGQTFFSALGLASIGVFFSYGGFHHASYLAGEVKDAQRTLPRAMIIGTLLVMLVYVSINVAYLKLIPVETIAGTDRVASTAVSVMFENGSVLIAALIALSTLGTISIYTMSAPRIYFALAEDGLFFKQLAKIHPKYHTPSNAIILQCIIACILLIWWQKFETVINYIVFVDYLFMAMAVFAVILLRKKFPSVERPYKTTGYPIVPLIFVGFTVFMLINNLIEKPEIALVCFAFLLVGYVAYLLFKRKAF